jgi:hypothetical protein
MGRGEAGTTIYNMYRNYSLRMTPIERQGSYAITCGRPGGPVDGLVNTDFQDLWLRFVSSVSSLIRENRVDQLLRSNLPASVNQQQVKKAARDLATNLSMHGYGMSYYVAVDLQKQINDMIKLFSDPQLMAQFGAHDMWGLIDYVAQTYLGGARNSSKYRTLATCGAIITTWLADNIGRLRDPTLPIINFADVENPPARALGQNATSNPTDYDLVNACELWLAGIRPLNCLGAGAGVLGGQRPARPGNGAAARIAGRAEPPDPNPLGRAGSARPGRARPRHERRQWRRPRQWRRLQGLLTGPEGDLTCTLSPGASR